ncbi:phosphodiesterase [Salinicola peritrichatus]|uniref:phosphodiesterase n=1 Tax=Salinicola peritrichatus TaxID=1267424 RepID=UPI000DA14FB5|nr:phosphodiesterase [Salinicola peritrichatus]
MLIAQISDPHVREPGQRVLGAIKTSRYLSSAVEVLNRLNPCPDLVLISGDATDKGTPSEYAALAALLEPLEPPWFLIPGNHDDRRAMYEAFPDRAPLNADGFIQYVIEDFPVRLIGLDTLIPGESRGELCEERLAWLDSRLDERPGRPTLIFMHHPPFATGIAHMDAIGLTSAAALEAIIRDHPNVERIICGHVHRTIFRRFAGTIASCCPSVAHQVALDLRDDAPSAFVMEPPGYHLHLWREGELITHQAMLGDYSGPYPFHEGGDLIDE